MLLLSVLKLFLVKDGGDDGDDDDCCDNYCDDIDDNYCVIQQGWE